MLAIESAVSNVPEFQGYISPTVEDAIKNDIGGDYILDFLKNRFLLVYVYTYEGTNYLSHSYDTIMKAIDRGAFVVANIYGQWMTLTGFEDSNICFQTIRTSSLPKAPNMEARIACLTISNNIFFYTVDLGVATREG